MATHYIHGCLCCEHFENEMQVIISVAWAICFGVVKLIGFWRLHCAALRLFKLGVFALSVVNFGHYVGLGWHSSLNHYAWVSLAKWGLCHHLVLVMLWWSNTHWLRCQSLCKPRLWLLWRPAWLAVLRQGRQHPVLSDPSFWRIWRTTSLWQTGMWLKAPLLAWLLKWLLWLPGWGSWALSPCKRKQWRGALLSCWINSPLFQTMGSSTAWSMSSSLSLLQTKQKPTRPMWLNTLRLLHPYPRTCTRRPTSLKLPWPNLLRDLLLCPTMYLSGKPPSFSGQLLLPPYQVAARPRHFQHLCWIHQCPLWQLLHGRTWQYIWCLSILPL